MDDVSIDRRARKAETQRRHVEKFKAATGISPVQAEFRDPETWPRAILRIVKWRANKLGLACDLTAADLVMPTHCPVLGIELKINGRRDKGSSPSIDRFDNSLGYVKGNVRIISNRANTLKRDATIEEIRALLAYMEGKLNPRTERRLRDNERVRRSKAKKRAEKLMRQADNFLTGWNPAWLTSIPDADPIARNV